MNISPSDIFCISLLLKRFHLRSRVVIGATGISGLKSCYIQASMDIERAVLYNATINSIPATFFLCVLDKHSCNKFALTSITYISEPWNCTLTIIQNQFSHWGSLQLISHLWSSVIGLEFIAPRKNPETGLSKYLSPGAPKNFGGCCTIILYIFTK